MFEYFPELYSLQGIKQEEKYHKEGDVFTHTKLVCEELVKLNEWESLNRNDKKILYLAAMFHDIGKGICTKVIDGGIVSPKHAIIGAKIFRELFYKKYAEEYSITFDERESIAWLIRYHGLPLLFMEKDDMNYELIKARENVDFKLLYLLSKSDLLGRECDEKGRLLENIEYFKEYSKELGCYYNRKIFANSYSRFLYLNNKSIWYGDNVYDNRRFTVYVTVGIPLAGKDTYIENNLKEIPIISLDNIREELGIKPTSGSKKVVTIAKERAKVLLRNKQSFVWNATNINKDTRKSLCRLFSDYGAKVEYIYIESPYNEILKRNKKRNRTVPETVINKMIKNMDMIEDWEGNKVVVNKLK